MMEGVEGGGEVSGRKLSGSSTMKGSVEILLNILHHPLGSISLSIIISGTYPALFPRLLRYAYIRRIVLRSLGGVGYYRLQIERCRLAI